MTQLYFSAGIWVTPYSTGLIGFPSKVCDMINKCTQKRTDVIVYFYLYIYHPDWQESDGGANT